MATYPGYVWDGSAWQPIGSQVADMSSYATKAGAETLYNKTHHGRLNVNSDSSSSAGFWLRNSSGSSTNFLGNVSLDGTDSSMGMWVNNDWRLVVDTSGRVMRPYQPSFKAYTSGGQINDPVNPTTMVFSDTSYGGGHNTGNHYNTSTGVFTAPVAGKYLFMCNMLTNPAFSTNDPGYASLYITLNNADIHLMGHNHNAGWVMEGSSIILNMSANDYVYLRLRHGSGHYGVYSYFAGCLLG